MDKYEHLRLPIFKGNIDKKKKEFKGSPYSEERKQEKIPFLREAIQKADDIASSFSTLQNKFAGKIDPSLIFEIEINQIVYVDGFEKELERMGIRVLSVVEGKKGFWVVFSDDKKLGEFKKKLSIYCSDEGHSYNFFNAIESFRDIPREKKIGESLKNKPLSNIAEFIDIELWKNINPKENESFINQLKGTFEDSSKFRITDILSTNSFVLLRVKLNKEIFDEIIELKEISRADRPSIPQFNPFDFLSPDVSNFKFQKPTESAVGILIIDSGIVSNHPMLEKCVGSEENFQSGEPELQDTVGHGTAVAGCAAYGNVENCLETNTFNPENWIFSAKVMYADKDIDGNRVRRATYDPEKLVEHQFKNAVYSFLQNSEYRIKVVNISLGNFKEIWGKTYHRQLPLAALIDELAFTFPNVIFIVSTGNQHPSYETISEIKDNYPSYLTENEDSKLINPATSALALTVGSIAGKVKISLEEKWFGVENIKTPIALENQPSPFTRTGFGINGMVKPELVEYGGKLILKENFGRIKEDTGGRIALLNNKTTDKIIQYDYGTSFSAAKVAYLTGKIANKFPHKSANFIKNMLLIGADYPFKPNKDFYKTANKKTKHLSICGFGLSDFEKAINSFKNRTVLWDEGRIGLNKVQVYSLELPEIFFYERGKKRIIVTLTFNPETRSTRGDSYLGNRMEFRLFHSIHPQILLEKYGEIAGNKSLQDIPDDIKPFEIGLFPGLGTRNKGCHQKAWKEYLREPQKNIPSSPISLVLLNLNKWVFDENTLQDYCLSVTFEHEKEIELHNAIKTKVQTRTRIK